jgi:hypothetical protein
VTAGRRDLARVGSNTAAPSRRPGPDNTRPGQLEGPGPTGGRPTGRQLDPGRLSSRRPHPHSSGDPLSRQCRRVGDRGGLSALRRPGDWVNDPFVPIGQEWLWRAACASLSAEVSPLCQPQQRQRVENCPASSTNKTGHPDGPEGELGDQPTTQEDSSEGGRSSSLGR